MIPNAEEDPRHAGQKPGGRAEALGPQGSVAAKQRSGPATDKLPLWRLIAGIGVLGGFLTVIGFLTPVYVDDMRLHRYVVSLQSAPVAEDATVQAEIVARARELDLPVRPADIHIVHNGGRVKIEMKYVVEVHLALYPVDLHFPTIR